MKSSGILHSEISRLVAVLGHGDEIVVSDYGLPVPQAVKQIDLAVRQGVPDFLTVLETVLTELRIEGSVLAVELKSTNPEYLKKVEKILGTHSEFVSHEDFKARLQSAKAVIRTGEWTPYANVILRAGVPF